MKINVRLDFFSGDLNIIPSSALRRLPHMASLIPREIIPLR